VSARIAVVEGDLALQAVDAVVSRADGVPGREDDAAARALAERGGSAYREERAALGTLAAGEAAATGAGALPAGLVVHVGIADPAGRLGAESLRAGVRRGLELAAARGCRTVALPALGTGPSELALREVAEVLLEEAERQASGGGSLEEIRFVLSGEQAYRTFESVWDARKIAAQMERMGRR